MGALQEIYKEYTHCFYPGHSRVGLDAVGKLILSNAENVVDDFGLVNNNKRVVEYTDDAGKKHTYTYFIMDDEFKSSLPKNLDTYDFFRHKYMLCNQCHSVTASYLEKYQYPQFRAITSLCYGSGSYFFHSYIWDMRNNYIYDFSRNIIMRKKQFDKIFVCREINVLSYDEYEDYLSYYEYMLCGEDYCRLMYLALIRLYEEKNYEEYVGAIDLRDIAGRVFNKH